MSESLQKPEIGSLWIHRTSEKLYVVYDYTNEHTERPEEYPVSISYMRLEDGTKWSRTLDRWHASYVDTGNLLPITNIEEDLHQLIGLV